jgi:translation initiation factor eIF-2B subunit gamma
MYGEVNREVADPGVALLKLTGLRPGRHDNIVPPSCALGNKATVASACILGEGCAVGDKSSIKRSVLGAAVK